ncbi:hypothetical protein LGR54_15135 [Ancylobacter sp. Lp-2]|uniref:hypothetical protein n=1 Tax=Ancylobacter sp. Lp-2 TaxID=2881339 RepID=UPI001E491030|nr:hypothetical protein [Ancylobacter sp. Lp-2]MCB4769950.1 hypothetical protein [Ancylobacter sp. Lp-2]
MTYQGPPSPLPMTLQDRLEGPAVLSVCLIVSVLLGFFGGGRLYPAPLAVIAAVFWHARVKQRNRARGEGSPMLPGYLILFVLLAYFAYGLGSFAADQMY